MKYGIRTPSLKKSFSACTTGRITRTVKKSVLPGYGTKGIGLIKDPKKAVYNKVYNKTTFSVLPAGTPIGKTSKKPPVGQVSRNTDSTFSAQYDYLPSSETENEDIKKVCKYCETENLNSETFCIACGANEFRNKCSNCGTVFDDGNFCPKCGVKVGAKAKKCPRCSTKYYSAACPDCGYTFGAKYSSAGNADNAYQFQSVSAPVQPEKKKKTWLWVSHGCIRKYFM